MDRILIVTTEFSIKSYILSEISSSMENHLREYISFGGVPTYLCGSGFIDEFPLKSNLQYKFDQFCALQGLATTLVKSSCSA